MGTGLAAVKVLAVVGHGSGTGLALRLGEGAAGNCYIPLVDFHFADEG